jgi:hypothetical protein
MNSDSIKNKILADMDLATPFDKHLATIPLEWRFPIVEVIDTANVVRLAMKDWELESPELLLGLTQLVLNRLDASGFNE